jgi:hypothetical protein
MQWVGHVARIGEVEIYKEIQSQHLSGKESFEELGCRLENNIKRNLEEVDMDSIAI